MEPLGSDSGNYLVLSSQNDQESVRYKNFDCTLNTLNFKTLFEMKFCPQNSTISKIKTGRFLLNLYFFV